MKTGELSIRSAAAVLDMNRKTLTRWLEKGEWIRTFTRYPSGRVGIPAKEVLRVRDLLRKTYVPRVTGPYTDQAGQLGPKYDLAPQDRACCESER